jgi:membrane protein YqaA with SNARE-associated domain
MTTQSDQASGERQAARVATPVSAGLSRAQRFERWSEILSALLLGLVTIATAWSGYQAARWGGEQSTLYADALSLMVESTRAATEANQLTQVDISLFTNYVNAYAAGDEELATFYYERFRPEARPAVDAWLATEPRNHPEAPPGPFQMPEYQVSLAEQASRLEERAAKLFEEGKQANENSDDYILTPCSWPRCCSWPVSRRALIGHRSPSPFLLWPRSRWLSGSTTWQPFRLFSGEDTMELLLDPKAWLIVVAFSVLGSIGNLALYQVGKRGVDAIRERFPQIKPEQWQRVKKLYDDFGSWILLLSGVPLLGSLLTTGAGAFDVPRPAFLLLVTVGKLLRNWLLVIIAAEIYGLFRG